MQGYEIPLLILLVLVVFGSSKIPTLAKNLGRAQKEFKDGVEEGRKSASDADADTAKASQKETSGDSSDEA